MIRPYLLRILSAGAIVSAFLVTSCGAQTAPLSPDLSISAKRVALACASDGSLFQLTYLPDLGRATREYRIPPFEYELRRLTAKGIKDESVSRFTSDYDFSISGGSVYITDKHIYLVLRSTYYNPTEVWAVSKSEGTADRLFSFREQVRSAWASNRNGELVRISINDYLGDQWEVMRFDAASMTHSVDIAEPTRNSDVSKLWKRLEPRTIVGLPGGGLLSLHLVHGENTGEHIHNAQRGLPPTAILSYVIDESTLSVSDYHLTPLSEAIEIESSLPLQNTRLIEIFRSTSELVFTVPLHEGEHSNSIKVVVFSADGNPKLNVKSNLIERSAFRKVPSISHIAYSLLVPMAGGYNQVLFNDSAGYALRSVVEY